MTEKSHRPSAKVIRFPPGGRDGIGIYRATVTRAFDTAEIAKLGASPRAAVGASWYHEAAVEDADRDRKR
jgi:hypothetical protein